MMLGWVPACRRFATICFADAGMTAFFLHSHISLDVRVGVVAVKREILELEIENRGAGRVDRHLRQRPWRAR